MNTDVKAPKTSSAKAEMKQKAQQFLLKDKELLLLIKRSVSPLRAFNQTNQTLLASPTTPVPHSSTPHL